MGIKKITLWVGSVLFLSCAGFNVLAAEPGFYFGLQLGAGNLNNPTASINTGVNNPTSSPTNKCTNDNLSACYIDDSTTPTNIGIAERLFLGSNINRYFGFEIGVANYTPSEYTPEPPSNPSNETVHQPHIWEYSVDFLGKVMLPLGRFGIFGKAGAAVVYKSESNAILDASNSFYFVPAYGAGISFSLSPQWEVDLSAMRIQGNSDLENIDFYALGISYHLVDEYCGQFLC